jgi:cyclopropane-fatty-acyl-phospholipid synthase
MTAVEPTQSTPRSSIVCGVVSHWRASPRQHSFTYPMVTFQLDLDELGSVGIAPRLFAFERKALCSVWRSDYLRGEGSLRARVEEELRRQGITQKPARITLITMPRLCGYVFNPVSFMVCFDECERVIGCVTQVNNTFGETHVYPLVCKPSEMPVVWTFPKKFFVSPFFDTEGEYTVSLESEGKRVAVQVDLSKQGGRVFSARLEGPSKSLTRFNLVRTLVMFPLTQLLTMPRIHLQALYLYFRVKATPFSKPAPSDPYTIRSQPNTIHIIRLRFLSLLRLRRNT